MDYLSNYYKNLCEQLQEKLNILEARYYDTAIAKLDDTETDEDIFGMRQNAADQGGIPQDMVNEPIRRTKQRPDGRLIYGESRPKLKDRPNIDAGPMIPKKPIPYPTPYPTPYSTPYPKDRPNIDAGPMIPKKPIPYTKPTPELKIRNPNLLDKNKEEYGIIPQTPEQRKKFGMSPYDNRMS